MATKKAKITEKAPAEEQPQANLGGAAGGGRGGQTVGRKGRRGEEPPGKLNGSIFEDGRTYNPGQEFEFDEVAKKMKPEVLQSLANQKTMTPDGEKYLIEGFGVEPDENAEELVEVTGTGSPGRRAGAREDVEEVEDEDEE